MSSGGEESARLRRVLELLKNRIGQYHDRHTWDQYKSKCNPYELVYTAPPCVFVADGAPRKQPISRAFYKLWEIVHDDPELLSLLMSAAPLRFAYAAEGPGGFIEAMVTLRANAGHAGQDDHTAITLSSERRSIPSWKLSPSWTRANRIRLCTGADRTGNLYKSNNVEAFVYSAGGPGSCDMVTGDGGFDFSADFNDQEGQMIRLLAVECSVAVRLLRLGGAAVIKLFDAFKPSTQGLLCSFFECFDSVRIVKPMTSRPANGERYAVCTGFNGLDNSATIFEYASQRPPQKHSQSSVFRELIEDANRRHSLAQIENILETMDAIDVTTASMRSGSPEERQAFDRSRNDRTDLSDAWFNKYGIKGLCAQQTAYGAQHQQQHPGYVVRP